MMNTVNLIGRITKDVEMRKTQSGKSVVTFTLAVTRTFNKNETDFILITAWNQTADFMARYISKGDLLGVVGRIQTSNYENKLGEKVYKTEIVADNIQSLESRKEKKQRINKTNELNHDYSEPQTYDITEEDLPF